MSQVLLLLAFAGKKSCDDNLLPSLCQQFAAGCLDNILIGRACAATCGLCGASPVSRIFPSHEYMAQVDRDHDERISAVELKAWFDEIRLPGQGFDFPHTRKFRGRNATYDEAAHLPPRMFWEYRMCESCHKGRASATDALVEAVRSPERHADFEATLSLVVAIVAARRSAKRDMMVLHTLHELNLLCEADVEVEVRRFLMTKASVGWVAESGSNAQAALLGGGRCGYTRSITGTRCWRWLMACSTAINRHFT